MTTIEEPLGEEDYSEESETTARERRLVTQSYDLSVSTLVEQWNDKTLTLPEIQRQYVWDNARASRLVESLLLNVPIPVVYFSETEDVNYLVIDGHQRIRSIVRFIQNEFSLSGLKIFGELNGKRFHQLGDKDQRQLKTRVIRAIIITSDSDPMMKFEVFERLNTGSIALNAQEVRNSTHRGPMNEIIKICADDVNFRRCIGSLKPRARMVDNELILRYLALENGWRGYRPPLKRFLNEYMRKSNTWDDELLKAAEGRFKNASTLLWETFGKGSFRLIDPAGNPVDRAVNRALAEVELTTFSWIEDKHKLPSLRENVIQEISALCENSGFLDSLQRATGDRKRTHRRLGMFSEALVRAGLPLKETVEHELSE